MLDRMIGLGSTAAQLEEGIGESMQAVRGIAHRVASAEARGGDFASALENAQAVPGSEDAEPVDLEQEMVSLAEEQLRFEAASAVLSKIYDQIRSGIREG